MKLVPLHLMTQRGQPYGSVRRCCERCGTMILVGKTAVTWTDNPDVYDAPSPGYVRCEVTQIDKGGTA